jgi:hypothetical protein
MPVFADRSLPSLSGQDLHESYRPSASVFELALNKRAVKILEALGIRTIGELLTTPARALTDQWGFGSATLKVIHAQLRQFLLDSEPGWQHQDVDFSSFEAFTKNLIHMTTEEPRDVDVLEKRLGVSDDGYWSLGKLGSKYGLTRERIRQIEEAGLWEMSLRLRRSVFNDFRRGALEVVGQGVRQCDVAYVARELARRYNWPGLPNLAGLAKLLDLLPQLRVDKKEKTVVRW